MFESNLTMEFVGGSRDGEMIEATGAPDYFEVEFGDRWIEVYERQNDEPPFVYVQIGYAEEEQWW
jgi:hypothetical protein